jgi:hypothetical protein
MPGAEAEADAEAPTAGEIVRGSIPGTINGENIMIRRAIKYEFEARM